MVETCGEARMGNHPRACSSNGLLCFKKGLKRCVNIRLIALVVRLADLSSLCQMLKYVHMRVCAHIKIERILTLTNDCYKNLRIQHY